MRALQALVIVMGIMLLAGTAAMAVLMVSRFNAHSHDGALVTRLNAPTLAALVLAPGEQLESASGIGEHILARISSAKGESLLVIDPATAAVLHRIEVQKTVDAAP